MHPTRLVRTVLDLATQLRGAGTVLLVGGPGVGKSLAWRALVAAVSGEAALSLHADPSARAHAHPPLVHCCPEALALPGWVLGAGGSSGTGQGHACPPGSLSDAAAAPAARAGLGAWLSSVLEGLEPQQVCVRAREEAGDVVGAAGLGPVPSNAAFGAPPSAAPRIQVRTGTLAYLCVCVCVLACVHVCACACACVLVRVCA